MLKSNFKTSLKTVAYSVSRSIRKTKSKKYASWSQILKGKYLSELIECAVIKTIYKLSISKNDLEIIGITYMYGNQFYFHEQLESPLINKKIISRSKLLISEKNVLELQISYFYCEDLNKLVISKCLSYRNVEKRCVEFREIKRETPLKKVQCCQEYENKSHLMALLNKEDNNRLFLEKENEIQRYHKCFSGYSGKNCEYFDDCYQIKNTNNCDMINHNKTPKAIIFNERKNLYRCNYDRKIKRRSRVLCKNEQLSFFDEIYNIEECNYTRGYINCSSGNGYSYEFLKFSNKYHVILIFFILLLLVMIVTAIVCIKKKNIQLVSIGNTNRGLLNKKDGCTISNKADNNYSEILNCDSLYETIVETRDKENLFDNNDYVECKNFNDSDSGIFKAMTKNNTDGIYEIIGSNSNDFYEKIYQSLYANPDVNADIYVLPEEQIYLINRCPTDSNISNANYDYVTVENYKDSNSYHESGLYQNQN